MTHASHLAAKVAAVNRAHAEVNRLAPIYREIFAQYIGQKVTKADGSLLAKIKVQLPGSVSCQVYSPHPGCFTVKTSENYPSSGGQCATYAEPYFYAFNLNREGLCEALKHDFTPYRADYTPEQVEDLRAKAEAAREAAREAESACGPFGTYDR